MIKVNYNSVLAALKKIYIYIFLDREENTFP